MPTYAEQRKKDLTLELKKTCKALGLAQLDWVKDWQHGGFSQNCLNGLRYDIIFLKKEIVRIKEALQYWENN